MGGKIIYFKARKVTENIKYATQILERWGGGENCSVLA
jgi:hypothetical protein